jgi:hypothetical protein
VLADIKSNLKEGIRMVKYYASMLLSIIIISVATCEINDDEITTKQDIQNNLNKHKNLRTRDYILLGTGIVVLSTGALLIWSANWTIEEDDMNGSRATTTDPAGIAGLVCIGAGIPITVLGTVMSIIRTKQYREYKSNMQVYGGYYPDKKKYCTKLVYEF